MKEELTDNNFEKKIKDLLSKKILSVSQIAKKLGIRRDVATGYLEALKNQGKLEFHKVGKSNIYTISQKQKMNKFVFFSVFLFLIIIPLALTVSVIENAYQPHDEETTIAITHFFMGGVGSIKDSLSKYNHSLPMPPAPYSAFNLKIFYDMQRYS